MWTAAVADGDVVSRVRAEVDGRWSANALREMFDLERKHGSAAWRDAQLEAGRHTELPGWRFGGPSAWLVFAAYIESELRYGPRHFAANAIGKPLDTFHNLEPRKIEAASSLLCLSDVSRPIWARAASVVREWHCPVNDEPQAVAEPTVEASCDHEFLSVNEAASRLGVNRKTLYEAFRAPDVPGVAKIGGRIIVEWNAFRAAIGRGEINLG